MEVPLKPKNRAIHMNLQSHPWAYIQRKTIIQKRYKHLNVYCRASLMAEWVRNLPAVKETQGQEDPLEKETATHNNIFA